MARKLDRHYLMALKAEFPFLAGWDPEIHTPSRPVTFEVKRELPAETVWRLELGRHNNAPTYEFHSGITWIWTSDGVVLTEHHIQEGETRPADLPLGTYILVCNSFRSELVQDYPGSVEYVLYKHGERTLKAITREASHAAAIARETLEGLSAGDR